MQAMRHGFNPEYHDAAPTLDAVRALRGVALLEFGAPWCGHCLAARSATETALSHYPNLAHIKIHDGQGKRLGRAFAVKLWPTLILLDDGEEITRCVRPTTTTEVASLLKQGAARSNLAPHSASPVCYQQDESDDGSSIDNPSSRKPAE